MCRGMGSIFPFRCRKRRFEWLQGITTKKRLWSIPLAAPLGLVVGIAVAVAAIYLPMPQWPTWHMGPASQSGSTETPRIFGLCFTGGGTNCVVDGDTAWIDGVDIRIADIDAPETHPPRCASEADLGNRATLRMQELLNQGAFTLEPIGRDEDQYGRKLRIVMRAGRSVGMQLVDEGLARRWTGRREPWC